MAAKHDLLIEIGTEELPPTALRRMSGALGEELTRLLGESDLGFGAVEVYATPRRLAVLVRELDERQPDRVVERKGPAVSAAFAGDGSPTRAAQGFARSCGVEVGALERLETEKGAWLFYRVHKAGAEVTALLPAMVEQALEAIPVPKRMRWGAGDVQFSRPVHWAVMLYGDRIVPATVLGVVAGNTTRGHRFHAPAGIVIRQPAEYAEALRLRGYVIVDFDQRREVIREQVSRCAAGAGGRAIVDDDLLEEVTALVEWPKALVGGFDARFLEVPPEVLITTMQNNQKYFPLVDAEGRLLPNFIAVANIDSRQIERVREGNERVIRPRFEDARFFWDQDLKTPLAERRAALSDVVYQKKLGSLLDKTERLESLCVTIARELGADEALARRAAELSRCDLLTEMVYEFPSLQGVMGRYYALHDGEPDEVGRALDEQYMPRKSGGRLPQTATGRALALADRLDTLVGIFAAGLRPSGLKDPFGLRRAALGVLRIVIEGELPLDLLQLLRQAALGFPAGLQAQDVVDETFEYVMERLRAYYLDRDITADVIDAVQARRPTRPAEFDSRVRAVEAFRQLPEADSLAAANKRIRNILRQAGGAVGQAVDAGRMEAAAEIALLQALNEVGGQVEPLFEQERYQEALTALAVLKAPVDRFFDDVMVMVDDEALKQNRLALLSHLSSLFLRTADLSRLQG